jgi:hypothetical protein
MNAGFSKRERTAGRKLLCQALGKLDQNPPIGRVAYFSKSDDEPQPFDNIQIDLILPKQLQ